MQGTVLSWLQTPATVAYATHNQYAEPHTTYTPYHTQLIRQAETYFA